jgi:hypothetical protein
VTIKDEYKKYQGKPEQIANRAKRNSARASVVKARGAAAVRGKDVDHAKPISKGGGNSSGNLRVKSVSANRSYKRNSKGGIA